MNRDLLIKLTCLKCQRSTLEESNRSLVCTFCGQKIPLNNGIPDFLSVFKVGKISWIERGIDGSAYDAMLSQADAYRLRRIDQPMLEYVRGEVLEIGSGTCRLAKPTEERQARYFGLDPVMPLLLHAQKQYGLERLVCGQGEKLPFRNGSFDCLISGFYAYRYVNPELGLSEAGRVLKKDGIFVFDLLNYWILALRGLKRTFKTWNWSVSSEGRIDKTAECFEFMNLTQLKKKTERAGFAIEKVISTPFIPFLNRLNKYISKYYFRGKRTIYLGYDVIIILRAI